MLLIIPQMLIFKAQVQAFFQTEKISCNLIIEKHDLREHRTNRMEQSFIVRHFHKEFARTLLFQWRRTDVKSASSCQQQLCSGSGLLLAQVVGGRRILPLLYQLIPLPHDGTKTFHLPKEKSILTRGRYAPESEGWRN